MMLAMLDEAYRTGTRKLCLTPHYQPAYYGDNREASQKAFERLSSYAAKKYPDLTLFWGNELGYFTECKQHLKNGWCRLLGGKYILVDFTMDATLFAMRHAVSELLRAGYPVILAHVERYYALKGEFALLNDWVRSGAFLQVNAESLSPSASFFTKWSTRRLFAQCPIHLVASDAHDLTERPVSLAGAEKTLTEYYGRDAAEQLLWTNPSLVLEGKRLQ
jgi:protein-tyrosine phosphatase